MFSQFLCSFSLRQVVALASVFNGFGLGSLVSVELVCFAFRLMQFRDALN